MIGTFENSVVRPTQASTDRSRLRLQRELNIFSSPKDDAIQRIVLMTSRVFKMPMVGISFMDANRHFFKYSCGLDVVEVPRSVSFCSLSYDDKTSPIYIIPDTLKVESFTNHPFVVNAPYVRFYCGASIFVDGVKVGVLCILDSQPHPEFGPAEQATLIDIANVASQLINHKRLLQSAKPSITEEIALQHEFFAAVKTPLQQVNSVMSQLKQIIEPAPELQLARSSSTTTSPCPSFDSDSKFGPSSDDDTDELSQTASIINSFCSLPRGNSCATDSDTTNTPREVTFNSEAAQFNPSLEQLVESLKSQVGVLDYTIDRSIQKLLISQQQHL